MAKQKRIPGTEAANKNPKLTKLAAKYQAAKLVRVDASRQELATRDELELAMQNAGLTYYEDLDEQLVVTIESTSKIKVATLDDGSED